MDGVMRTERDRIESAVVDRHSIELRVDNVRQLFHTLDPYPFIERDLDQAAEEFIVSWARELALKEPIRIIIYLPASEASSKEAKELGKAVRRYFADRARAVSLELKECFRLGRLSLAIGISVLALCTLSAQAMSKHDLMGSLQPILTEGLIILGWVANWRPIEILLYDWWPIARHRNLLLRLSGADVRIVPMARGDLPASGSY
jgi:hypothetical protein